MHDLLFTTPGADYPFSRQLRVHKTSREFVVALTVTDEPPVEMRATSANVDAAPLYDFGVTAADGAAALADAADHGLSGRRSLKL